MNQPLASIQKCFVCGKPVDPDVDIMLTAGSVSLMPVHQGACRETIKRGVETTRDFVESRYPLVKFLRVAWREIVKG